MQVGTVNPLGLSGFQRRKRAAHFFFGKYFFSIEATTT